MQIHLVDTHGVTDDICLNFEQLPVTLGRADDATVRITNVLVSRHHCEFAFDGDHVVVRDLGSMNGTFVNGSPVTETRISAGHTVQIGLQTFRVQRLDAVNLHEVGIDAKYESMQLAEA